MSAYTTNLSFEFCRLKTVLNKSLGIRQAIIFLLSTIANRTPYYQRGFHAAGVIGIYEN
jgi:hypothetical protein